MIPSASRSLHYRPNFHSPAIFRKSWEYAKNVYTSFVDLDKAYDRVPRGKLWKFFQEHNVDSRLLLAVKSLYSFSEVCVHVGGV